MYIDKLLTQSHPLEKGVFSKLFPHFCRKSALQMGLGHNPISVVARDILGGSFCQFLAWQLATTKRKRLKSRNARFSTYKQNRYQRVNENDIAAYHQISCLSLCKCDIVEDINRAEGIQIEARIKQTNYH
jgi:hypothetical protein